MRFGADRSQPDTRIVCVSVNTNGRAVCRSAGAQYEWDWKFNQTFWLFYSTTMAELQVLSPMLRANEEANAERRLAVNNPNISRRRFVASHLYAMCTMTLLCITTIIM